MGRIHRYLLKGFALNFLFCLVCAVALFVMIDLSANLGRFLEADRTGAAGFIALYYLNRVPLLLGKLLPLAGLLGAAFTLTLMEKRNELTPIKASGISMTRFTLPLVAASLLLSALSLALEQWAAPWAGKRIHEENLKTSDPDLWYKLIRDPRRSQYIFYVAYFTSEEKMKGVYVSKVDPNMREREFIYAGEGRFSRDKKAWILEKGYRIAYGEKGVRLGPPEAFERLILETSLLPSDMEAAGAAEEMSLSALARGWRRRPNLHSLGVEFHFKVAMAAASPLLMILGLPVILAGARRRFYLGAAATFILAAVYYGAVLFAHHLGVTGAVSPAVAGWGPPAFFGAVAAATFDLAPT